jgi:hypothetical protein
MKKKKRPNEVESDKRMARFVALLQPASRQFFQEQARKAAHHLRAGSISDRHAFGMLVCPNRPAEFLRLVIGVLEGKRLGGKYDDALLKAYDKALLTAKQRADGLSCFPLFSEVYDALKSIGKSQWVDNRVAWKLPTKSYVRRRLKALRLGLLEERDKRDCLTLLRW